MSAVEQSLQGARPKAIVFDLDGTLYDQRAVRRAMLARLLRAHALRPRLGLRTLRALGAYRSAQEDLRLAPYADDSPGNVAEEQLRLASERTGYPPVFVHACVTRWMEEEPLELIARYPHAGMRDFMRAARGRGIALGLLSDYPADAKLHALDLDRSFDAVVTAQSPSVGVLKPHPRGLRHILELLETGPAEAVFVGDRVDVDAAAATAAGVACYILTGHQRPAGSDRWLPVGSYAELTTVLLAPASLNRTSTGRELEMRSGRPSI
jgi:phosphoglycolate phosphatase/putative hydrolase of the HAD superfamily